MMRTSVRTLKPVQKLCSFFSVDARRNVAASGSAAAASAGDDLLLDNVTAVKPLVEPTLLQPRVVVYDGVCHLCHGGIIFRIIIIFFEHCFIYCTCL